MLQTLTQLVYNGNGKVIRQIEKVYLTYTNDNQAGITRQKKGKGFIYLYNGKQIRDKDELMRIKRIVIPPAWRNVWICKSPNGHIQATGFDTKNRKQYKYHPFWNRSRNQTKFDRLLDFGEKLPQLRSHLNEDLAHHTLDERKVIATVISLMEHTYIRVGSNAYEKLYGSHGLTTLKDKHVNIKGNMLRFSFKGKKGIHHTISLKNKKLARIVKECREIPGKELFQYYNENNETHVVDSGHINTYIKEASGEDFTTKDFRTWAGTLHALSILRELGEADTQAETRRRVITALDYVSEKLGNTRAVCKKYYVHPLILDLYEKNALHSCLTKYESKKNENESGWTTEEQLLLQLLKE